MANMNESRLNESSTMHVRKVSNGSSSSNNESVCDIKVIGGSTSEVSLGNAVNMSMASLNESMVSINKVKNIDESVMLVKV